MYRVTASAVITMVVATRPEVLPNQPVTAVGKAMIAAPTARDLSRIAGNFAAPVRDY